MSETNEYHQRLSLVEPQLAEMHTRIKHATSFVVIGTPIPQGSKWAFVNKRTGRAQMLDENSKQLRAWRKAIVDKAIDCMLRCEQLEPFTALAVDLDFHFARPGGQLAKDGSIRASAPREKLTRPDLDKLVRAVFDALTTARVVDDDNAIVELAARKRFSTPGRAEGVLVKLMELKT